MNFAKFLTPFVRRVGSRSAGRVVCVALSTTGLAGVAYTYMNHTPTTFLSNHAFPLLAQCAAKVDPQGSVISDTKNHALFLTIHLKPGASTQACLKAVGQLQQHVDTICPPSMRDESDEIWFGVGFGPEFLDRLKSNAKPSGLAPYPYRRRSGPLGDLPSTGGDIFIHAKCHERGKLFELCQAVIHSFPAGSIDKFEDIYGWVYRGGRDLSGFIDGTENPADEDDRIKAAIDPKTKGSYVVAQRWIHKHDVIRATKDDTKSQWIGREIEDSTELKKKTQTAHVSRMVGYHYDWLIQDLQLRLSHTRLSNSCLLPSRNQLQFASHKPPCILETEVFRRGV
ncbi:hypothetical protein CRM22_009248 [Opisthorchis felineus]|uniref:Dyp-type peroxidase n=1 Tax=Opisthorchis felineus TaxID=147828 RepID=A0A4S2LFL4_OPIFE|nr:hypothetical protein CRM22_009248 [Opisthorchis felineus]